MLCNLARFRRLSIFSKIIGLKKFFQGCHIECRTVWFQIRMDELSGLIWVQTVCKLYQQTTMAGKEWRKTKSLEWKIVSISYLSGHAKTALSGDFCSLLITFASRLDPDLDRQNVSPDLDPNRFDTLMVFQKFVLKKVDRGQQKYEKIASM